MRIHCTDRCEGQATVHFSLGDAMLSQSITGKLRGPFCEHSRTLPSNFVVEHGRAVVVDPCFWTPKLPFLYEAQLRHDSAAGSVMVDFQFGLRWCITERNGLRLNGKPYVVRAVTASSDPDLAAFRAASASLVMPQYSEQTCLAASKLGVLVICIDPLADDQSAAIQRFPAVHFARAELSPDIIPLVEDSPRKHHVCLTEESTLNETTDYAREAPRFIVRRIGNGSISELRKECDWLQRDTASIGQFAGYLIDSITEE